MVGGGQERGVRPGTLPVPLVVALGAAAELATKNYATRQQKIMQLREEALASFLPLKIKRHGDPDHVLPHVLNISFPGVDSEAIMVAWKGLAAVSNGAACTSHSYALSHVLQAMQLSEDELRSSVRISWCHLTEKVPWSAMAEAARRLM
jgi:cysteine desulfurase